MPSARAGGGQGRAWPPSWRSRTNICPGEKASPMLRRHVLALGTAAATGSLAARAQQGGAEAWPSRPVTILVPFVAGGPSDIVARVIAQYGGQSLSQPVVVENRTGAN